MWCGPSPVLPYMAARHHWSWRWHTNYGRGQLMDWIGHHNDIAHWGLGLEATGGGGGPVSVEAKNWDYSKTPDIYDTAWQYDVISKYPKRHRGEDVFPDSHGNQVDRDRWLGLRQPGRPRRFQQGVDQEGLQRRQTGRATSSPGHQRNFIDCVLRTARRPSLPPRTPTARSSPGHIAYVSHELGRAIKWDPVKEAVVGDEKAQKILTALPYRGDWKI